jgi:hypothetical protein
MKIQQVIDKMFTGAILCPDEIRAFVEEFPEYLSLGINLDVSKSDLDILNQLDCFEFHFRKYVLGTSKTLRRVLEEVRKFTKLDEEAAYYFINWRIDEIRQSLLSNEWYELLPHFDDSTSKIKAILPAPTELTTPILLSMIQNYRTRF